MEDEKKKKRNKKKKNKQNKTTEEVAVAADENHVTNGQNDDIRGQASEKAEIQNGGQASEKAEIRNGQVDLDRHQTNGTESTILAEAERLHLLRREAILEGTIKQLQNERESHMQIEATLEDKIKQLKNESDSHKEKVGTLEEKIKHLRNENELHMQKEAILEETIKQLQNKNDSCRQKEGGLEMNVAELQNEKDAWLKKEASLEEKIKLLEEDKDSWIRMESISKETIARLNRDITRLQMQVVEVEESQNNLLLEKQQLKEYVSSVQFQLSSDEIKRRNSEQVDFSTQIEAACALVDKLITENVELVEKVNELSVKLDKQSVAPPLSSSIENYPRTATISDTKPVSESCENISAPEEVLAVKEERNRVNHVHPDPAAVIINSSEPDDSEEIVQIPLEDNEVRDLELQQVTESNEQDGVPLTDAPLIGAPFRFVSFVAKYVSGADLVNNNF